ncbi:hypothetical protein ACJJTC_018012, partial [Scirpophaga incertulas]
MNLIVISLCSVIFFQKYCAQDYPSTYNTDLNIPNPTNEYNRLNDPKYDNPYDPNKRYQNPNINLNTYDSNQRYDSRNDIGYNPNTYNSDSSKPTWDTGRTYSTSYKSAPLESNNLIINEATYFIVASKMVRPGQIYKISANILQARLQMTVRASISRDGVEIADVVQRVKEGVPEILNMRIPATSVPGDYKLQVEGLYLDNPFGGRAFVNETQLTFSTRFMTIFIQMDKPVYMQGQTVRFRAIPINTELKAFGRAIDVFILDPNRRIMKRWLSRQSNFGTVSLQYQLSDQPVFGEWTIRVEALGQVEESQFLVEEYYQTRFEVNVTMPAFFFNTDKYIHGKVMANYTSGAPVHGNLTLRATVRPIPRYRPAYYAQGQFNNRGHMGSLPYDTSQYTRVRPNFNPYLYNETGYGYEYGVDEFGRPLEKRYLPGQPNQLDQPDWWYDPQKVYTKMFTFFKGTYDFKFPMAEIEQMVPSLDGVEVIITAAVGDPFYDEVIEGYSIARVFNSSLKVSILGGSPQVFKPAMPFDVYMVVSYHDGSPLSSWRAAGVSLLVQMTVEGRGGAIESQYPTLVAGHQDVWHLRVDLYKLLRLEKEINYRAVLNEITGLRFMVQLADGAGHQASAEARFISHQSENHNNLRVSTTTTDARVGHYIIFHVESNFYLESFNYVVMSKGIILTTGQENMQEGVHTFAVTVSAEMAPAASVVVWAAHRRARLVADCLTFPVNGVSRNNFTVVVNNRKQRTGERVEVAVHGEPGAYVGLAAVDDAFYGMQAGNDLTYAKVISKMAHFDESTNGTSAFTFRSHFGDPDQLVYFPSTSFGIDVNRTFEYSGLVVFTDVSVPRRPSMCNESMGFLECMEGGCYHREARCDGKQDCSDRTDEAHCEADDWFELSHFRKFRFNRVQRQYDNVWLWRDINIGPHGRFVFTVDVPQVPAHWTVSAFSMSAARGLGMLQKPIRYSGVLPFSMKVEGPYECRQGEQVGLRVVVFNYQHQAAEAVVVLEASADYKFVHVEEDGIVRSYNPRTSFGEHQFFVWIAAGDTATVLVPVVPARLGHVDVRLSAAAMLGQRRATHRLHVTADGLPQQRHQSVLLDLSNRAYVFQYMHVNVTETPVIPYEADRYYVYGSNRATLSVVGDVVGPLYPTLPVNATSLLHLPM